MLNSNLKKHIKEYCKSNLSEEMCGAICEINNTLIFKPITNCHNDKKNNFKLDLYEYIQLSYDYEIKAIVHSHINGKPTSFIDIVSCNNQKIDFIIYDTLNDVFHHIKPKEIKYLNHNFEIGVHDCYSLVRDFYKNELNIELYNYRRNEDWFTQENYIFDENFQNEGFVIVDLESLQKYDCLLFKLNNKDISNHIGIYLENDVFLHHPRKGKSQLQELNNSYRKRIKYVIRHKNIQKN